MDIFKEIRIQQVFDADDARFFDADDARFWDHIHRDRAIWKLEDLGATNELTRKEWL